MSEDINIEDVYARTKLLLGNNKVNIIKNSKIVILGLGGVGSYTVEALARIGIGNITIVDKDVVDITNINRQLIATTKTIGQKKVDIAKSRINDINPNINVVEKYLNVDENNINQIINDDVDYVIDCIDDFDAKINVAQFCYKNKIKIISSMGMANKLNPLNIKVADINKTIQCKLAKKIRKKLKELHVNKLKVVYSVEETKEIHQDLIIDSRLGSVSFVPSVAGLIIASEVVKDLTIDF